ncbi:PLP-dependent transferase [Natrinema zhouii]|uniref:PLP-dependent transferase n=1 Tax=Natrinema zhouii TaxID=1710539 RepID=UPI001CFFC54F|nr:PLP-dependent transferase [Natrinema zhouii]
MVVGLGGTESLVDHPATMSASYLSAAERKAAEISNMLVRISVGIGSVDDLIADLIQALANHQ